MTTHKLIYLYIFLSLLLFGCKNKSNREERLAYQGCLNLRPIDLNKTKIVKLNGQWEFYWEKLISHADQKTSKPDTIISLPSIWKGYSIKGNKLGSFGYASYRLKVWLKDSIDAIGFKIQDIPTSSELYVNGTKIYSAGIVGTSQRTYAPNEKPAVAFYLKRAKDLEIILQIANYSHRKGGLTRPIEMGTIEKVTSKREKEIGTQLFLFGALLIMSFYHIGLWALRKDEKSTLYFAAFTFSIGLYALITGETYIKYLWPNAPWEILLKLEYLIIIWAAPFFLQFLNALYEEQVNKIISKFNLFLSVSISVFVVISDPYHYSQIMPFYHLWIGAVALYCIWILLNAARTKQDNAKIFLLGFAFIFAAIVHDILLNKGLIESIDLVPYGYFVFIFSQAYLLSAKFSNAFKKVSYLKNELTYINKNLEQLIQNRTEEINQQKEELMTQCDEIEKQKITLKQAVKTIEKTNKDITDSIRYAKKIQQAAFPSAEMIEELLPDSFVYFKPKDIVSGDFYWIRQNKNLTYIAVADCTGHGVPGGFMSMLGIAFLNEITNREIEDASFVLEELRRHMKQSLRQVNEKFEQKDGLDMSFCIINNDNNIMQFAGANSNLQIIRDFTLLEFKGDRMPIGVYRKEKTFHNHTIELAKEDIIYLYSDGYASQFGGERNEKFKSKRMNELLYEIHKIPMQQQRSVIAHTMDMWKGENPQIDDILVIGFKII